MTTKDTDIQEDGFGFVPSSVEAHSKGNLFEIVRRYQLAKWHEFLDTIEAEIINYSEKYVDVVFPRYTLTNKNGAAVRLITWGAGIQSIRVPNNQGVLGDVALGFDNIDGYLQNRCIGRITNRLAIGIKGNNNNSLFGNGDKLYHTNGEFSGLDNVNWDSYILDKQVVMSHLRCQDGYPANMLIQAKYSWTDENELTIKICATATVPSPANITTYCSLNLAGHGMGAGELKNHIVTINSDKWLDLCTRKNLWNVTHRNVNCTVFDLRNPTQLKNRLQAIPGGGYDHNLCINSPNRLCYRFHGRVLHPDSGRFLELYSDQPMLQFYTANNLPDPEHKCLRGLEDHMWGGCGDVPIQDLRMDKEEAEPKGEEIRGKDGVLYRRHGGLVLSPQSILARTLYPGKVFEHNMTYKFGVRSKND